MATTMSSAASALSFIASTPLESTTDTRLPGIDSLSAALLPDRDAANATVDDQIDAVRGALIAW